MKPMAVITAFGGVNAAGRSSGHQAFRRIVIDALDQKKRAETLQSLASLMGTDDEESILAGTLVREWDNIDWDPKSAPFHQAFEDENGHPCWRLTTKRMSVQSAGQMPKGFDPGDHYRSRHHPRGLKMAIFAASDMLGSLGMDWDSVCEHLNPDEIGVYAGSAMAQLDTEGYGGMIQAPLVGKRTSSKQCAMGFSEMPADFLNAYVLGNLGGTGSMAGACATFLYNLLLAKQDIEEGRRRLVIVGNAESPLVPGIIDGYAAMTALATEQNLHKLDGLSDGESADLRRASRPFSDNCGFTIAESAQFFVLTDDALAIELGLNIHGSIGDVFVNADGYKKSISNPGVGNYLTMGKALASAERALGEQTVRFGSFVHAHGSSTPANRVTESHIFSELAKTFNIENWPILAAKAHLGHSIGAAAADQLLMTLGTWSEGILPGITTSSHIAADVHQEGLDFVLQHRKVDPSERPLAFINAKGFGGNNASAWVSSPLQTLEALEQRHPGFQPRYQDKNAQIQSASAAHDQAFASGSFNIRYRFGDGVLEPEDLKLSKNGLSIKGWNNPVPF